MFVVLRRIFSVLGWYLANHFNFGFILTKFSSVTLTVMSLNDSISFHTTIFRRWSDCARTPNDPGF